MIGRPSSNIDRRFEAVLFTERQIEQALAPASPSSAPCAALWMDLDLVPTALPGRLKLHPVRTEADWTAMHELRMAVETAILPGISSDQVAGMIQGIRRIHERLDSQWFLAMLPESPQPIGEIGIVRFDWQRTPIGGLQDVDIHPQHQGGGLGNELLQATFLIARAMGIRSLCLKAEHDDWPLQWYQRRGFVWVGEMDGPVN